MTVRQRIATSLRAVAALCACLSSLSACGLAGRDPSSEGSGARASSAGSSAGGSNPGATPSEGGTGGAETAKCREIPGVNSGRTSGPLTLRGHVSDASGDAVVGARFELTGSASAVRYSDLGGNFSFHLEAGVYALAAGGDCTIAPGSSNIGRLEADASLEFSASDAGCVSSRRLEANISGSLHELSRLGQRFNLVFCQVLDRGTADDAEAYVRDHAATSSWTTTPCPLLVDDNFALEVESTRFQAGAPDHGIPDYMYLGLDTSIQVGSLAILFSSQTAPDAPREQVERLLAIGRNFTLDELPELHAP